MIRCDAQPGRTVIRSRSMPTWALALVATLSFLLMAFAWFASTTLPRVLELECDRGGGRCRLLSDGTQIREIALAEADGAEVQVRRGRRQVALLITRRSGKPWRVSRGEPPARIRRDAVELKRFLSGAGPDRLSLRWDHTVELLLIQIGFPLALLLPLTAVSYPMVCTVDRLSRRIRVRYWRVRELRLDAIASVRVQTGADEVEERRRRIRERTGREPGFLGPRIVDARRAAARRILLVDRDGGSWPITAWLREREDPGPVAERLRSFLLR
jgi:hypothetical protein